MATKRQLQNECRDALIRVDARYGLVMPFLDQVLYMIRVAIARDDENALRAGMHAMIEALNARGIGPSDE